MDYPKCDSCGKTIIPGNNEYGEPNGVGFVLKDGTVRHMCADCIAHVGRTHELPAWAK